MKLINGFRISLTWMLLCCGCIGAVAAPAYYSLQAEKGAPHLTPSRESAQLVIGLGPVTLPEYLDRMSIVTRTGPNRLVVHDGHRWAGSLQSEITRVLAADLESRVHAKEVVAFPWTLAVAPDLRFQLEIQSFEGRPGESVILKAAWTLVSTQSNPAAVRHVSMIKEKTTGYTFEDLAAAMGRALAALSTEMADSVHKITATK